MNVHTIYRIIWLTLFAIFIVLNYDNITKICFEYKTLIIIYNILYNIIYIIVYQTYFPRGPLSHYFIHRGPPGVLCYNLSTFLIIIIKETITINKKCIKNTLFSNYYILNFEIFFLNLKRFQNKSHKSRILIPIKWKKKTKNGNLFHFYSSTAWESLLSQNHCRYWDFLDSPINGECWLISHRILNQVHCSVVLN